MFGEALQAKDSKTAKDIDDKTEANGAMVKVMVKVKDLKELGRRTINQASDEPAALSRGKAMTSRSATRTTLSGFGQGPVPPSCWHLLAARRKCARSPARNGCYRSAPTWTRIGGNGQRSCSPLSLPLVSSPIC